MRSDAGAMATGRMEAFSDGVIAVIITIMVLELHVPHVDGAAALREIAPRLSVYLLSFAMTGIYWLNHHELVRRVERVHYVTLAVNLLFLFVLSLVPLSTDYVGEKHFSSFAVAQYAAVMLLAGMSFGMLRLTLRSVQKESGNLSVQDAAEGWKHAASLLLYLLAIASAYWHPMVAMGLNTVVAIVWLAPSLGTGRVVRRHADRLHSNTAESR